MQSQIVLLLDSGTFHELVASCILRFIGKQFVIDEPATDY